VSVIEIIHERRRGLMEYAQLPEQSHVVGTIAQKRLDAFQHGRYEAARIVVVLLEQAKDVVEQTGVCECRERER
jgi:hypothetical protein